MTAKAADKLIILGDVCRGLLARVYNLTGNLFKKPQTLSQELERVLKRLQQKFPEHPADLDKEKGWDLFQKRASEITAQLQDYYLTFVDVLDFDQAAHSLLMEMGKSISAFQFDNNLDLMTFFMDLFVGYFQLHMLVSRVTDSKLILSTYARAFQCANGNTEPNFLNIARYLQEFENPLETLRERLSDISLSVGNTLLTFTPFVLRWSDTKSITTSNLFSVLEDANNMDNPKNFKEHQEIIYMDRFTYWTMVGFLVCPEELQRDNALTLLQMVLRTTFLLPVYRDQMFSIHEEFDKLFEDYKMKNNKDFKLSKHKKVLKEVTADALVCLQRHVELRNFLRLELHTLLHFFQEFPQLLAPKLQMVLCALRLLRNELLWYLQHLEVQPFKAKKYVKPEEYNDPRVAEYIWLLDTFSNFIRDNKQIVQQYYVECLRGPDAGTARPVVEAFFKSFKVSHGIQELLNEIIGRTANANLNDDFEAIRLNWYRASALINAQQSGIGIRAQNLNSTISLLLVHSRNVDRLDNQVKSHASVSGLFWYRKVLHQVLMDGLSGTVGQARYCMSLVRIVNQGLENVHRICPEEQKLIGTKAVATAELFFNAIITAVGSLFSGITQKIANLRAQSAPIQVVHRQQSFEQTKQQEPRPGYESINVNRHVLQSLRVWKRSLSEICCAMHETERIVIYNTEFVPREWLYEAIAQSVRASLLQFALPERAIQRPSALLLQLQDMIYAYSSVEENIDINLKEIIRAVLFKEFSDLSTGGCGDQLRDDDEKKGDSKAGPLLIHALSSFYINILSKNLADWGVTYSELKSGFVSHGDYKLQSEQYADLHELKALCSLIGPYGVRALDRGLLSQIAEHVRAIKTALERNLPALKEMRGRFSERAFWFDKIKVLQNMDDLIRAGVSMGCILKFRTQLRLALREVSREKIPFIYQAVQAMASLAPATGLQDAKLAALDLLASDVGVQSHIDQPLLNALKKFKLAGFEEAWEFIPEIFAASIARAPQWKEAQYLIETESHANNIHCVAATVTTLISTFKALQVETGLNVDAAVRRDMEAFARCAANSILHMCHPSLKSSFSDYHMPSIMIFVEQFVRETRILDLSLLEDFFPFTILRTNYIQLYEKQDASSTAYAPVTDEEEKTQ